jgi:hypothetical protein
VLKDLKREIIKNVPKHKKPMKKYSLAFIWSFTILLFSSCVDSQFDLDRVSSQGELTPYIDVPLGSTTISMKDLLEKIDPNTYIKTGVDNILYFDYLDTLYSLKASQLALLPNQGPQSFSITVPGMVVPSTGLVLKQTYNFAINLGNNASFSTAYLKSGNASINLTNASGVNVTLDIPGLTNGTTSFNKTLVSGNNTASLAGDSLKVDNSNPNSIILPITFTLTAKGGSVITPGTVAVNVSLNNLSFSIVKGNIGTNEVLNKSGSVSLSMFNNSFIHDITFTDPQFSIITENSYGAGVRLTLSNVVLQTENGPFVATFNGGSSTYFDINKATTYGAVITNTNTFTRSNTTLFDALTKSPQSMNYTLKALTNPNGGGANSDFALDTSKLNVYAKIHIPVKFSASAVTLQPDTIDFDFDKYYDTMKHADSAKFVLETSNEFPLATAVTLAAVDENYQYIMKIYNGTVLKSGVPNSSNPQNSTSTVSRTESVNLTNADIEKLKVCKHFLVYTTIGTSGTATIYSNYKLSLKLSVLAKARIKF